MSQLLRVNSTNHIFSFKPQTPIVLNPKKEYELALRSFHSYNSIPNIEDGEKFYYYDTKNKLHVIEFPTGSYEITDIESFIRKKMGLENSVDPDRDFSLKPNNNTLKCEIFTFDGDRPTHTIYEFAIKVDPGYIIDETPSNLLYLSVVPQQEIHNITVLALDQEDVTLAPNYGAFLFDSCVYSDIGKELETVRDPGIVSTVRALTCCSPEESKHMSIAGWNYPTVPILSSDKSFSLLMPIFNMFNDYPLITCGRQTLRFVRARNDNDCVIIKEKTVSGALTKTSVKLVIESIELRIKHIYPSDEVKEKLLKFISTNRPIMKWFRKWELHELPALTPSARREIWSVKISTKVERPRYVIVFFQTEKRDNIQSDPTTFDHIYIQSIRLSLNGDYYPNERTQLDFDNNHFTEAHFNYSEFQPSYTKNTQKRILLDYLAFKNRALFVIDCSKQEETMKSGSVDVKLDIEANNGFPENTKAYCIIIHDVLMEYSPLTEVLKNLS
ncbi:unnamed protein product [Psylliodes chrysocephalus]|uniref:Double jelly roll-like domain-containing protein n=1 Tax=Psylliodes chrysocephalus TaxID=3402493 RepID=A0A9P0CP19_9CUCU|nr:unnamed protein product [Psylliodes chrysocephala]